MNIDDILDKYEEREESQALSLAAQRERSRAERRLQVNEERDRARAELKVQNHRDLASALEMSRKDSVEAMLHLPQVKGFERGGTLVVQLSDLHFGATAHRDGRPPYRLETAAKRLRLYAQKVIESALIKGTRNLVVALTGDLIESRMGKNMPDKTTGFDGCQTHAAQVAAHVIASFIQELRASNLFDQISIHGVPGNEARLTDRVSFEDSLAAENYDCKLHAHLSWVFGSDPKVKIGFSVRPMVIEVEQLKVLLIHGNTLGGELSQRKIRETLAQYGADFGLSGHIHYPYSCADWARSGSLIGECNYAADGINLRSGRASQTIMHFQGTRRDSTFIDLDDPGEIEGYAIPAFHGAFGRMEDRSSQNLTAA